MTQTPHRPRRTGYRLLVASLIALAWAGTAAARDAAAVQDASRLARPGPNWYAHVVAWNESPVDLSFLNANDRPAGKRGFIKPVGEDLVFEDGTRGRFWGTSITAYALYHTPENAVSHHAKRLAKLGFNLVRLTHHDSRWVGFNIFGKDSDYKGTLNEEALKRLDWWIKCLKDEGIYVWLDFHVGREFGGVEDIEHLREFTRGEARGKAPGFNYVNTDVQTLMGRFSESFLKHVNQFTKLAYGADPGIIVNLITNENDLTHHFGNALLPDKNVPAHTQLYMDAAQTFARANRLDPNTIWHSWQPGASKLFLADLEHKFNQTQIDLMRGAGARALLVTTNFWGEMSVSGVMSMTDGDIVDAHAYAQVNEIVNDPHVKEIMLNWHASAAVAGKPLTVSEWNVEPFPAFDRASLSPRVAAIASLQGWSGMLQYAYSQSNLVTAGGPENYAAANDPAFIATLPIAALLYRQGHVAPAQKTYALTLPRHQFLGGVNPRNSRAIRMLTETSKLRIVIPQMPELPWLETAGVPEGAEVVTDVNFSPLEPGATKICSDTNEICRDWGAGIATIDTAKSQVAAGWIGGRPIALKAFDVDARTPNATVALQSLDDQDIAQSKRLLITATAQSVPTSGNRLPFLSEPVEGRLTVRAAAGLKAFAVHGDGSRQNLPSSYSDGAYTLELNDGLKTFWIMLTAD